LLEQYAGAAAAGWHGSTKSLEANHAVVDTDLAVVQKPAPVASNFIAVAVKQVRPAVARRKRRPLSPTH
jgi:hypothetical protein